MRNLNPPRPYGPPLRGRGILIIPLLRGVAAKLSGCVIRQGQGEPFLRVEPVVLSFVVEREDKGSPKNRPILAKIIPPCKATGWPTSRAKTALIGYIVFSLVKRFWANLTGLFPETRDIKGFPGIAKKRFVNRLLAIYRPFVGHLRIFQDFVQKGQKSETKFTHPALRAPLRGRGFLEIPLLRGVDCRRQDGVCQEAI